MLSVKRTNHPGRLLKRELEARELTQVQFAGLIDKTPAEVSYIVSGRRNINPEMAIRIGAALGTSADVRLNMQHAYDIFALYQSKSKSQEFNHISKKAKLLSAVAN